LCWTWTVQVDIFWLLSSVPLWVKTSFLINTLLKLGDNLFTTRFKVSHEAIPRVKHLSIVANLVSYGSLSCSLLCKLKVSCSSPYRCSNATETIRGSEILSCSDQYPSIIQVHICFTELRRWHIVFSFSLEFLEVCYPFFLLNAVFTCCNFNVRLSKVVNFVARHMSLNAKLLHGLLSLSVNTDWLPVRCLGLLFYNDEIVISSFGRFSSQGHHRFIQKGLDCFIISFVTLLLFSLHQGLCLIFVIGLISYLWSFHDHAGLMSCLSLDHVGLISYLGFD